MQAAVSAGVANRAEATTTTTAATDTAAAYIAIGLIVRGGDVVFL
jgi:hypothetical protein